MKKQIIFVMASLALIVGCKEQTQQVAEKPANAQAAPAAAGKTGNVVETMNAGGYTYVQVDTGSEKIWAAAPEFAVAIGDPVVVPEGMLMTEHHSKTLDRTFEKIYFVDTVLVGGAQAMQADAGMPQGHPPVQNKAADVDFSGLKKAEGGATVGEIFTGKDKLAGKDVVVRGKVVKFSPEIMGKNWLHVQDGTGAADANDLTVTTSETVKVGDTVLVTGKLTTDKDFGYGYKYAVIVEDAKIKVE
ncbi:MAG: hypothetical protein WDA20_11720 [Desulfuromonadales bacterium]